MSGSLDAVYLGGQITGCGAWGVFGAWGLQCLGLEAGGMVRRAGGFVYGVRGSTSNHLPPPPTGELIKGQDVTKWRQAMDLAARAVATSLPPSPPHTYR